MSRPLLLDTCVLLWMGAGAPLGQAAEHELSDMESIAGGIVVSPISAWEVGQLARRGRLRLPMSPPSEASRRAVDAALEHAGLI